MPKIMIASLGALFVDRLFVGLTFALLAVEGQLLEFVFYLIFESKLKNCYLPH